MKETRQPILHIIVFAIFILVASVMFYLTQRQLITLGRVRAKVKGLSESQGRLVELESSLPAYSALGGSWQKTLPTNAKDVAAFAGQIEGLAKTSNLTITINFDDFPGPVDILGHYVSGLGAEITLVGSFSGVTNFLSSLSGFPYFFKIDKMTITKPETKVGVKAVFNGVLMMNIKI